MQDEFRVEPGTLRTKAQPFAEFFSGIYPELVEKYANPKNEEGSVNKIITKNVTFIVTDNCNLRCSYCYQHNKGSGKRMTKEIAKKIVDTLFEEFEKEDSRYISERNSQAIILEFIGGEPLLEIDLIDWIVDYFRLEALRRDHIWALHHWISISTNGINYEDEKVSKFIMKNKGKISITVSLDGNKDLHDACRRFEDGSPSYDIAEKSFLKNLKRFQYAGTKLTLAPGNIGFLFDAHKHMLEMGIKELFSNTVFEEGWTVEHAKIMYSELKKLADYVIDNEYYNKCGLTIFDKDIGHPMMDKDNQNWCGGTGSMIAFDYDGIAYPCLRYAPLSLGDKAKPMTIGNIKDGVDNTEEDKKTIDHLNKITRSSQSSEECMSCPINQGCAWCSAYNYEITGDPNKRVTYTCIMHKARTLANSYYWNKLYKLLNTNNVFRLYIPKEWALEIIDEEEYNYLLSLAE